MAAAVRESIQPLRPKPLIAILADFCKSCGFESGPESESVPQHLELKVLGAGTNNIFKSHLSKFGFRVIPAIGTICSSDYKLHITLR